ncbi:hypothetical protein B566_EDAN002480 [Ephemera danica]|nr:hypothetical protein B566_EDAN002480 [Ephemera danica]
MSGWSGGGHGRRGGRRQDHGQPRHQKPKSEGNKQDLVDENSPVIKSFRLFATELDAKHDKYERLVKLSRDVTIESKRIIFLLHTITGSQAEDRFHHLEDNLLRAIAVELKGEDPYQFLRGFAPGIQEYIEAKSFYVYLKEDRLEHWKNIQEILKFEMKPIPTVVEPGMTPTEETTVVAQEKEPEKVVALLPPTDYILGLADLTGELMRRCINCLGMGQVEMCYQACNFMRDIHRGFLGTNVQGCKELGRKLYVLRQSLVKTENACYTIHVRGSEVPKHLLADVLSMHGGAREEGQEEDEGYY